MRQVVVLLVGISGLATVANALVPPDPGLVDLGIAVASAAAGAASQVPRIQHLEKELAIAHSALTESEQEMVSKIKTLEEKLFLMDEEFEGQSARMKKQFDGTLRDEMGKLTKKLKEDYEYSTEIKLQEEKGKMLQEKLDFIGTLNGNKETELVDLRLKRGQMEQANKKLEEALRRSDEELQLLHRRAKKGWWPF